MVSFYCAQCMEFVTESEFEACQICMGMGDALETYREDPYYEDEEENFDEDS